MNKESFTYYGSRNHFMLREKNMFNPLFLIVAYWLMSYPKIDNKMKKGSNGY